MKVKDLVKLDCLRLMSDESSLEKEINDLYTSDLLSWVMGHVKEEKTVLLTVLNTINAVAVATLLDMSAIIFCDNVIPTSDIVDKANEENIAIFSSKLSSIKTAKKILDLE